MTMIILVSLKTDTIGTCVLACTKIQQDPFLEDHLVLEGIQGLNWPFSGRHLGVNQWSVQKDTVMHWMVGDLENPHLNVDMLTGGDSTPHPPGTLPAADMGKIQPAEPSPTSSGEGEDEKPG